MLPDVPARGKHRLDSLRANPVLTLCQRTPKRELLYSAASPIVGREQGKTDPDSNKEGYFSNGVGTIWGH